MESCRHRFEGDSSKLHGGVRGGDGDFGQADSHLTRAILWLDLRSDPLQRTCTAGVQPNPLGFAPINANGNPHAAPPKFERKCFGIRRFLDSFQQTELLSDEVDLDNVLAKKICPKKAVDLRTAGPAEVFEVESQVFLGQL